jgi:hypothetical protein
MSTVGSNYSFQKPDLIASSGAAGDPGKCSPELLKLLLNTIAQRSTEIALKEQRVNGILKNTSMSLSRQYLEAQNLRSDMNADKKLLDQAKRQYDDCNDPNGKNKQIAKFWNKSAAASITKVNGSISDLDDKIKKNPQFANVPIDELVSRAKEMSKDPLQRTGDAFIAVVSFLIGLGAVVLGAAWEVIKSFFQMPGFAQEGESGTQLATALPKPEQNFERDFMRQLEAQ